MPGDEVTVVQRCGKCDAELGTFSVKKDNLFLTTKERVWCLHAMRRRLKSGILLGELRQ